MRAFILTLLLVPNLAMALPPKALTPVKVVAETRCVDRGMQYASGKPAVAGPHRLGDLPHADRRQHRHRRALNRPDIIARGVVPPVSTLFLSRPDRGPP